MTTSHVELESEIFRQALDGMSVGMLLVDSAGRLVWANRAAEGALGIDAESARGRVLGPLLVDPQISSFWQEAARAEGTMLSEASVRSPHPAHLKLNASRCVDSAGRTIGRALLFCDVTAERAVQIRGSEESPSRPFPMTETAKSSAQPRAGLTAKELEGITSMKQVRLAHSPWWSPSAKSKRLREFFVGAKSISTQLAPSAFAPART